MSEDDTEAEAALEVTLLSIDIGKTKPTKLKTLNPSTISNPSSSRSWWKPTRYYAVAWIDLTTKQSTGVLNSSNSNSKTKRKKGKLYFPVSLGTLGKAESRPVTIQILSHCRLPFHGGRLVGTAVLPLSEVKMCAETFALPLRRGSGEILGSVSVSARVLWDLGFRGPEAGVPVSEDGSVSEYVDECECEMFGSSDPPLIEESCVVVEPSAPPEPESVELVASESVGSTTEISPEDGDKGGSFLVKLIGSVFVAVMVGFVCSHWRAKSISSSGR